VGASGFGQRSIRVLAFLRKELVGVVRQPLLVVLLVLGPFGILLLFGAGLGSGAPAVTTVVVAPEGSAVAEEARRYAEANPSRLRISEVTADLDPALRRLRGGDLDLVVDFPADIDVALASGEQPSIVFYHDYLDPIEADAMVVAMRRVVDDLNAQVAGARVEAAQQRAGRVEDRVAAAADRVGAVRAALARGDEQEALIQLARLRGEVTGLDAELGPGDPAEALSDGEGTAAETVDELAEQVAELASDAPSEATEPLDRLAVEIDDLRSGLAEFGGLAPGLFVRPFQGVAETVVEGPVDLSDYYTPAVLVLLAQHLGVTFLGLSVVRDGELGTMDLLRVAPVSAGEVLLGKSLAYLLLTGAVTAALTGLLVAGLGVPVRGEWALLALTLLVILFASTALGFALALAARSIAQAVAFAMLLLLANVFFSGFLLSLDRYREPVRSLPRLLPATYGVELLRQVMLRGDPPSAVLLGILTSFAVALFALSWLLLRRRLRRA